MSTIDSFFFVSSITIGNDLITSKESSLNTKIGLIITGIISYIIANKFTFVIDVWYVFGSIAASSLLIPFLLTVLSIKKILKYPIITLSTPIIEPIKTFYSTSNLRYVKKLQINILPILMKIFLI